MFMPQQRCYSFAHLCGDKQTLQSLLQLACAQISFGHNLLYVQMTRMGMVAQAITGLFFPYQIEHLGLQDLIPYLVVIHCKMVVMLPPGNRVCPGHNLPAIICIKKFPFHSKYENRYDSLYLGQRESEQIQLLH